jgi:broad specificity phosphatase PhoE
VTTFFLVRHALHSLGPDRLAGRLPGVTLIEEGRIQAERLARRLAGEGVTALQTSPQQRTLETARPIAERCGVKAEVVEALDEVDFGEWAGKTFQELDSDPRWSEWNSERERASTPAGETITGLAKRIAAHIDRVCDGDPAGRVVLVSHAEPIRTAILHYLGLPFSAFTQFRLDPASISQLVFTAGVPVLANINKRVAP